MEHAERLRAIRAECNAAQDRLIRELESIDEATATRKPADNGWTAAQAAWHVGQTNELLAGVLTGAVPMAQPAPAGFQEQPWGAMSIPAKIETFPQLHPPEQVDRKSAIEKIRAGGKAVISAIEALPEERSGHVIGLSFGSLTLVQVCEFVSKHSDRHLGQIKRAVAPAQSA